jgi:hypothetical protein
MSDELLDAEPVKVTNAQRLEAAQKAHGRAIARVKVCQKRVEDGPAASDAVSHMRHNRARVALAMAQARAMETHQALDAAIKDVQGAFKW